MLTLVSCISFRDVNETQPPIYNDLDKETNDDPVDPAGSDDEPDTPPDESGDESDSESESDSETETEPEPPVPYADTDISFMAVGDNLIHANIWMGAQAHGTAERKYDFRPMYEELVPFIEAADVAFINQETVMAGDSKYGITAYPSFNSPQQLGLDIAELGFDVVNVATNHIIDKGESGYKDFLDFMHTLPFTTIGGYYNKADHDNIRVTEVEGVKIAWLSFVEHTNVNSLPSGSEMFIPYSGEGISQWDAHVVDREFIISSVEAANQVGDIVIASLHAGSEYEHFPNKAQKEITQIMADYGVDVIIGHHSHCLQPIEWIDGVNGNKTLCIYSLGNIVSGQNAPLKLVGGIFTFRIVGDGEGGLEVVDPHLDPTIMYYDANWLNDKVYLLENYTDEIAATHGMLFHEGVSLTPAEAAAIVKGCIDAEYLPEFLQ